MIAQSEFLVGPRSVARPYLSRYDLTWGSWNASFVVTKTETDVNSKTKQATVRL
jgi:hypothetical protein